MDRDIEDEFDYYAKFFPSTFSVTDGGLYEAGYKPIGSVRNVEEIKLTPKDTTAEIESAIPLFGSSYTGRRSETAGSGETPKRSNESAIESTGTYLDDALKAWNPLAER